MSEQPQAPRLTPELIFGAANAYQLSLALRGAIDLDLFTAIGEGNTDASSLASSCSHQSADAAFSATF